MVVAAYLVGGFLVASVYATGMLRGRTDRYHRLGFVIAFSVAAVATPIQMGVGDALARWVYNNQPVKFAAIELVPTTSSDVPETLLGRLNDDGTVSRRHPDPGAGVVAVRPEHRHGRPSCRGWTRCPRDERPTVAPGQHRPPRLGRHGRAWGRCCSCCRCGTAPAGCSGAGCRRSRWFLRAAAASGVLAVITHGGRLDRDRGRPPAVDRLRDHEGRGRGHRQHRGLDHVRRGRRAVPRAGHHHDPGPARNEQAVPQSRRLHRARCALRHRARRPRTQSPTPEEEAVR